MKFLYSAAVMETSTVFVFNQDSMTSHAPTMRTLPGVASWGFQISQAGRISILALPILLTVLFRCEKMCIEFDAKFRGKHPSNHVKSEAQFRCRSLELSSSPGGIFARVAVVFLLLVSVAALSTLAKDGQYFPKANPARYVSISTTMNLAHAPIVPDGARSQLIARISPPQPSIGIARIEASELIPIQRIAVTVSLQHRSPPVLAA